MPEIQLRNSENYIKKNNNLAEFYSAWDLQFVLISECTHRQRSRMCGGLRHGVAHEIFSLL
jgi:hypothetical protein